MNNKWKKVLPQKLQWMINTLENTDNSFLAELIIHEFQSLGINAENINEVKNEINFKKM